MLSYGDSGRAPFVAEPVFIEVPPTAAAVKAGLRPGGAGSGAASEEAALLLHPRPRGSNFGRAEVPDPG